MFCIPNYDSCYILHPNIKFFVNLDGNLKFGVVKCNFFFVFKGLRRGVIGSFYMMLYFSIQVNNELDVGCKV